MGTEDVAGWVAIGCGAVYIGHALRPLARAGRAEARSAAFWSGLLVGLSVLVSGVFELRYPHHGAWLRWASGTLLAAALILMVVPWMVSRQRSRPLRPTSAGTPGPGPGPAIALDAGTASLVERIKHVRFSTTRLAPGYDEEEVDVFLDKIVAALSQGGQLDRSELSDIRFTRTRFRPGYTMPDVDTFLAEVARAT